MTRPKHCRIYVKRGDEFFDFMWADVTADGSVTMGFVFPGSSKVEFVLDRELGELRQPQLITTKVIGHPKLTFHASGHYKLTAQMGKSQDAIDRVTVLGPKLAEIIEPRRMSEILLPNTLPRAKKLVSENDIALDASTAPPGPLRCVISCMSRQRFEKVIANGSKIVNTSIWEFIHALETVDQVWSWVLRRSANDSLYPNRFFIFLAGDVKWGQQQSK
jgi:hypothetical protein